MQEWTEGIGKLGFGMMRLPKDGDVIDTRKTSEMVDLFMQAGFNYFDTAWAYAGSEEAVKAALVDRYPRDSYLLATKLSAWIRCETREDAMAQFTTSLERTGAGYFDLYLLHNLGGPRTGFYDQWDLWSFGTELKERGLIRHLGISSHGTADELEAILEAHPEIEFVQLQVNYADWDDPVVQSRLCYETARRHGKPVIVMEPVKGGMLANPPEQVKAELASAGEGSCASWAIRFAANLEGVITVLSGMSTTDQVEDNLACMKGFKGLTASELECIGKARQALKSIDLIPCTNCNYCAKVCPMGIGISGTFSGMNGYSMYGNLDNAKAMTRWMTVGQGHKAANECIGCHACEAACPQSIRIVDELARCVEVLGIGAEE